MREVPSSILGIPRNRAGETQPFYVPVSIHGWGAWVITLYCHILLSTWYTHAWLHCWFGCIFCIFWVFFNWHTAAFSSCAESESRETTCYENKFAFFVVAYFVFHIFLLHYFSSIFVFKFVCIPRLMICFLCCRFTCLACYIILSMAVYIFCCFAYDCLHIPCIFCILHITLAQGWLGECVQE